MGWVLLDRDCVTMHSPQKLRGRVQLWLLCSVLDACAACRGRSCSSPTAEAQSQACCPAQCSGSLLGERAPSSCSCLSADVTRCSSRAVSLLVASCYRGGTVR